MRKIYAIVIGAGLGAGSVFLHASLVPFGLIFVLLATLVGIWSIGRMWGGRTLKVLAAAAWTFVVLRAGFPGLNQEYIYWNITDQYWISSTSSCSFTSCLTPIPSLPIRTIHNFKATLL